MKLQLSRVQLFLILFIVETGVVFITVQASIIIRGGRDSWLMFICFSIFHYGQLFFYEKFYKDFQLNSFFGFLYKLYWMIICITFIAYIDYTLAVWGFPNTPTYIVIGLIVFISLYANLSRPETAINLGVIIIPLIGIFIIFILMATPDLVWTNIFPIGTSTPHQWFKGLQRAQYAYMGVEVYLIYRSFVLKNQIIKGKPLFIYQLVVGIFYTASVIGCQLYFSLDEIKLIPEPIIYILKAQEVTFVKRLDIFFIYIWLAWSIVTITLFVLSIRVVHFAKKRKYPRFQIILLHLVLVVVPIFLERVEFIEKIRDYLHYGYIPFTIILPILIIIMNRRRKKSCLNESPSSSS
ncbi:GerAB/ArcD/ProY family transporter [Viridibacillus arvi]|uniref:GerAB/ArcD/ProY family transporter n=1 Tax=Viridibacillus arvi TaxID=263475 RepID=UPI003D001565